MGQESSNRSPLRGVAPSLRQLVLVLVVVLVGVAAFGFGTTRMSGPALAQDASPVAEASPVATGFPLPCAEVSPDVGFEAWVRTELYFGAVSDEEWQGFLDAEVTPRFPDGLTVLEGYGQWRNSAGVITEEDSIVLIIFYPLEFAVDSSTSLEEIREEYKAQFDQESVLRVDDLPVCVSF